MRITLIKSQHNRKPLIWAYYNAINEHMIAMRIGQRKVLGRIDLPKSQNLHLGNEEAVRASEITEMQVYNMTVDTSGMTKQKVKLD